MNSTPLTAKTRGIFNQEFFHTLKHSAFFINVGRGEPAWDTPNMLLTGHYAGFSPTNIMRGNYLIVENLRRYVAGEKMLNVVNLVEGY